MRKIYLVVLQNFADEYLATDLQIDCYDFYEDAYFRFHELVELIGNRGHVTLAYNHVKNICCFENIDGTNGWLRVIEKELL